MAYSVELLLAAPAAITLDGLCERIEADPGIETYRRLGSAPHISLAVYDNVDIGRFEDAVSDFAHALAPTTIHLNALGAFCHDKSVLFVSPVVSDKLLALHHSFHRAFAAFDGACWDYYRPGNWVPHVTLAMNLDSAQLSWAIGQVAPAWRARDVLLDEVRLISFPPFRALARHRL